MLLSPPRPTLFPYTTLFRSGNKALPYISLWDPVVLSQQTVVPGPVPEDSTYQVVIMGGTPEERHAITAVYPRARIFEIDRKSTRLNSSHITISYAVFCLKKK